MCGGVPGDTGVAEVGHIEIEDGVVAIGRPCAPVVDAEGDVLGLAYSLRSLSVACVDGDEAAGLWTESAGVVGVDDDAAGEDHGAIFFGNGYGQLMPVEEVGADGMAPAHVAPLVSEGVVLEEEMVFAVIEDEAVGIVGPVARGGEVYLRAKGLIVVGGLRVRRL